MPKTIVCRSIASTYRFWFSVFGRIVRPRRDRMLRLSTSAGRSASPACSIPSECRMESAVRVCPAATSSSSSSNSRTARALSAGSPLIVISLPRTWMSLASASSMILSSSSREPSRPTMACEPGTTILV